MDVLTDSTLTITIDRTSLSLSPLVLSGSDDANDFGVTAYQAPALQSRNGFAPDSGSIHGSEAMSTSWQQALLSFSFVPDHADDEADAQASYLVVAAAIGQFSYAVTTEVNGAPAQVWAANPGSISPPPRTYIDMVSAKPTHSVTIPVYPIPGGVG